MVASERSPVSAHDFLDWLQYLFGEVTVMSQHRFCPRFIAITAIVLLCAGWPSAAITIHPSVAAAPVGSPGAALSEGRYRIDAGQSHFTVRALVGGLLSSVAGHDHTIEIGDFSGTAAFTYGSVTPASL